MVSIHFILGLNTKVITIPLIVNELADYFVHTRPLQKTNVWLGRLTLSFHLVIRVYP